MKDDIYGMPVQIVARPEYVIIWANMINDPYERAMRLFNLGVRGGWSRAAVRRYVDNLRLTLVAAYTPPA